MKKSTFTVRTKTNKSLEVSGYISDYFGIHKMIAGGYAVTHLLTGLRITSWLKMGQARKFIGFLEASDINWEVADRYTLMEYIGVMTNCCAKVN